MSLYAPIRNEQTYPSVQKWLTENLPIFGGGSPEGFMAATERMVIKSEEVREGTSDVAKAVRKVATAFTNVEWSTTSSSFVVKSGDMVYLDTFLEALTAATEQAQRQKVLLSLQDVLRESRASDVWLITDVADKKAKAFGFTSAKAQFHLFVPGDLPEGETDLMKVYPKSLASLTAKNKADVLVEILKSYGSDLLAEEERFAQNGLGIRGYRLNVEKIKSLTFPGLGNKAEAAVALLRS